MTSPTRAERPLAPLHETTSEGLCVAGVPVRVLMERFGSPLFVFDAAGVTATADRMQRTLGAAGARLYFSGKANPNPFIWRWLHERKGFGLDACSPGEVGQALAAGFSPEHVSFTGCALTPDDMDALAASGVTVTLDAADQALGYAARHPGKPFGLRVNPGLGAGSHAFNTAGGSASKLGIPRHQLPALIAELRAQGAALEGLHCHSGSGSLDVEHFVTIARQMTTLTALVPKLAWLNLGGGMGVPHGPDDARFDLDRYAAALSELCPQHVELRLEPGEAVLGESGVLLMTVVSCKIQDDGTRFALTDSSCNHYLGTSLYGSWHDILVDLAPGTHRQQARVDVVGHICNNRDVFARARMMPVLEPGDRLLMATCGAYGLSHGANYNSRPLPAELWIEAGTPRLIRRRQAVAELSAWYV